MPYIIDSFINWNSCYNSRWYGNSHWNLFPLFKIQHCDSPSYLNYTDNFLLVHLVHTSSVMFKWELCYLVHACIGLTHLHASMCTLLVFAKCEFIQLCLSNGHLLLWVLYRFIEYALRGKSFHYLIILFFQHSTHHFRSSHFCTYNLFILNLKNLYAQIHKTMI